MILRKTQMDIQRTKMFLHPNFELNEVFQADFPRVRKTTVERCHEKLFQTNNFELGND